jgi:hypothetical protein
LKSYPGIYNPYSQQLDLYFQVYTSRIENPLIGPGNCKFRGAEWQISRSTRSFKNAFLLESSVKKQRKIIS